jgi:hypothetical protein
LCRPQRARFSPPLADQGKPFILRRAPSLLGHGLKSSSNASACSNRHAPVATKFCSAVITSRWAKTCRQRMCRSSANCNWQRGCPRRVESESTPMSPAFGTRSWNSPKRLLISQRLAHPSECRFPGKCAPITSDSSSSRDAWGQLAHLRLSRTCRNFLGRTWKGDPPEDSNSNLDWRDQFFRLCSSHTGSNSCGTPGRWPCLRQPPPRSLPPPTRPRARRFQSA